MQLGFFEIDSCFAGRNISKELANNSCLKYLKKYKAFFWQVLRKLQGFVNKISNIIRNKSYYYLEKIIN